MEITAPEREIALVVPHSRETKGNHKEFSQEREIAQITSLEGPAAIIKECKVSFRYPVRFDRGILRGLDLVSK